jgi:cytochrome c-type biogenesis protein CcsB
MTGPGLLYLALAAYVVAAALAGVSRKRGVRIAPLSLAASALGLALQLGFVVFRTLAIGFLPFASRFESMALFAFSVQAVGFIVYLATRRNSVKAATDAASALLLVGALMPVGFHAGGDLNPILNSPWFAFHILVSFAGYACFTVALAWALARLFDPETDMDATKATKARNARNGQGEPLMHTDDRADVSEMTIRVHQCPSVVSRSRRPAWPPRPLSDSACFRGSLYRDSGFDRSPNSDSAVLRRLALSGLLLLGTGILTGAMWADGSWGTYWSWDPKESWALLTWVLGVVYVHWAGRSPGRKATAVFFTILFAAMMFTFIGINLLKWGLHRY